jgi:hypothetical protein
MLPFSAKLEYAGDTLEIKKPREKIKMDTESISLNQLILINAIIVFCF